MWTWIFRHLPGPAVVRALLVVLVMLAATLALFTWVFPWVAAQWPGLVGRPDVAAAALGGPAA